MDQMHEDQQDCSRLYLYRHFLVGQKSANEGATNIRNYLQKNSKNVPSRDEILQFIKNWRKRWCECYRSKDHFEEKYSSWLGKDCMGKPTPTSKGGRKRETEFETLSDVSKRRRTSELRKEESSTLLFACTSVLRKEHKLSAVRLLQECFLSPDRPAKMLKLIEAGKDINSEEMSTDEALSIIIDANLSRLQYNIVRAPSKARGKCIYPSYNHKLLVGKQRCYPHGIEVTESEAKVGLRELVDHTAYRLIQTLDKSISGEFTVFYKWGFDGSSGQSEYKQLFHEKDITDKSVIITTLVPVRIIDPFGEIIWKNITPASTRYCRPIRIAFEKETEENIAKEFSRMKEAISNVTDSTYTLQDICTNNNDYDNDDVVCVNHRFLLSMIDGKIVNSVSGNKATQRCPICKKMGEELNDLESATIRLKSSEEISNLKLGLSPLHARIHFMEFLLNLSYRLILSKPKGFHLTDQEKNEEKLRKKQIQKALKENLKIIVDAPKQGFGTSNDGNTARKFFENPKETSKVIGIKEEIIERFAIILTAINVNEYLNPEVFGHYAYETVELYLKHYSWYTLTPTVHKVLIHGEDFIIHSLLPLGSLSEEAQESRNKDFRNFRIQFARKCSRVDNLTDVFGRFLVSSDPLITYFSQKYVKNKKSVPLPDEVAMMVELPKKDPLFRSLNLPQDIESDSEEDNEDIF